MTSPPPDRPPHASPPALCPACSAPAFGRYCANCGAPLPGAVCSACKGPLTAGSKFCHHCGTAAGPAPVATGKSSQLPWIVAAVALLAMFAMLAGRGFNARRGSTLDAPLNALPQAGLDDRAPQSDATADAPVRAPDISALSPQERVDRLFDRVMLLNSEGKSDSVAFFAPMALTSYQMLAPLNADQRYDMGRIGEVAGALPLAKAQADSILLRNPNHLLGLILAARIASLQGNKSAARSFERRLLAAEKPELAKKLEEYDRHRADITAGVAAARRDLGNAG